jgi:beta-lactamase regulating signal transducer with metallopeptidase domain
VWLLTVVPRVSAALRHHWIVTGMIAVLLMPVFMTRLPSWSPGPLTRYVPVPSTPHPGSLIAFPAAESESFARATSVPVQSVSDAPAAVVAAPVPPSQEFPIVPVLWLAGSFLLGVRILFAAATWRRAVRSASLLPGQSRMDVRLTSRASSPVSGGLWRPVVLLPPESMDWPADRMNAVLAHEEAHLHRRDAWWLLLGHILCAAQWFNPLAWLLHRRAAILREEACDAVALQRGVPAAAYADALLALASPGGLSAAASPMARRTGLERRIRAVLNPAGLHPSSSRAAAIVSVVLLCALTLCASVLRSQEKPVPTPVPDSADDAALKQPLAFFDYSKDLSGEVILDPGGWTSPPTNVGATIAFAETLDFCIRVKKLLETNDLHVFLTRSDAAICSQEERIRLIKEHANAIVLSIQPGDYEEHGHQGMAAGVAVARSGPSLSRSVILAHNLLTKFAQPSDLRLPPVYLSKDTLIAASTQDTAAVILHTGSASRSETAWRNLVFNTVESCRDSLRNAESPTGKRAQMFLKNEQAAAKMSIMLLLNGRTAIGTSNGMRSDEGSGIAVVELNRTPCVVRWIADQVDYTLGGGKNIDAISLSGSAAMQILASDTEITGTEITGADRISCSLPKQTMHLEGQFQLKCLESLIKGARNDSSADLSAFGPSTFTRCSLQSLRK